MICLILGAISGQVVTVLGSKGQTKYPLISQRLRKAILQAQVWLLPSLIQHCRWNQRSNYPSSSPGHLICLIVDPNQTSLTLAHHTENYTAQVGHRLFYLPFDIESFLRTLLKEVPNTITWQTSTLQNPVETYQTSSCLTFGQHLIQLVTSFPLYMSFLDLQRLPSYVHFIFSWTFLIFHISMCQNSQGFSFRSFWSCSLCGESYLISFFKMSLHVGELQICMFIFTHSLVLHSFSCIIVFFFT